jgi:DUF438 domain-containing protein
MSELINNSEHRQEILKELIKSLHEGKTVDDVKKDFSKYFGNVSTTEISQIEQALVKEGLPVEEVQRLCDVHAAVFKGSIEEIHAAKDYNRIIGHPVNVLMEENKAIEKVVNEEIIPYLKNYLEQKDNTSLLMLRISFDRLSEVNIHYSRKEYLIFPHLEKRAITTPPKVMWGVDDEIRTDIKELIAYLSTPQINEQKLKDKVESVLHKVSEMIFKENNILIPLLSETLTFYDWVKIDEATPELGYCLVKPARSWKVEAKEITSKDTDEKPPEMVRFDAGGLIPEEIYAIFNTLPFDLTFVDADNKVKYFTQGKDRIFQRPKTIIGRDVSMCHPPASVHIVEKMIEEFKNGEKDHEDFWINIGEAFVYIRYFAVRNSVGTYLGTLEVTQNIKPITSLKGEKRLTSEKLKATD